MATAKTEGFRVLPSYFEAIRPLPDAERLALYDAIWDFGFGNEVSELPPLLAGYFGLIRPSLEKSIRFETKQRENGSKGGRPPKTQTEPRGNPDETQTKTTENLAIAVDSAIAVDNAIDIAVANDGKPPKHKFGSYGNVILSESDMEKLRAEFPADYQQRIERLSEYMESTGKKYKSHLATIRSWAARDKAPKGSSEEVQPIPGVVYL